MKKLKLKSGIIVQVDDQDATWLWKFSTAWRPIGGYISCAKGTSGVNRKYYYIHKMIAEKMGLDISRIINHKDRNLLNNQRCNLREATNSQSKINRRLFKNNKLGYKGIYPKGNKFRVQLYKDKQTYYIGTYKSLTEAIKARDKAVKRIHGDFGCID